MQRNVITAVFGANREARTQTRYRYDYGQVLMLNGIVDLPVYYEMHFAKSPTAAEALRVMGTSEGVSIPDSLFQTAGDICAWVYVHTGDSDGETVYRAIIPVTDRPKPEEPTEPPVDPDIIEQAITALNENVGKAEAAADSAEASASAASDSEDAAAASETAAQVSADAAADSQAAAAASALAASGSAAAALSSEGKAKTSELNAAASATAAAISEGNAKASEQNAAASESAAAGSATNALGSAATATAKATLAESWAVGGTNTRTGEDTDNAKYYAEVCARHAEDATWAFFDIDESDGEMYVTTTDNLDEYVSFEINENTGELVVTIT